MEITCALISNTSAFHICAGESELTLFSFLCPNGTLFNQQYFVCDWWFNVDCANTARFYALNDELGSARRGRDSASAEPRTSAAAAGQQNSVKVTTRAGDEPSRNFMFHNHREDPY